MVGLKVDTTHNLQIVCVLESVLVGAEEVAGQVVVVPVAFHKHVLTDSCRISRSDTRPDTVRNVHLTVHLITHHLSVGEVGREIELLDRSDDKLGGVGEIELFVVVLVLPHREDDVTSVGHIVLRVDHRIGVQSCPVRIEQRKRGRIVTKVAIDILNVITADPGIFRRIERCVVRETHHPVELRVDLSPEVVLLEDIRLGGVWRS